MPTIRSVSEFRQNATAMIDEVNQTSKPLYLTVNGRNAAVVVSTESWEKTQKSLAMLRLLTVREKEVTDGDVMSFDEVMDAIEAKIDAHGE